MYFNYFYSSILLLPQAQAFKCLANNSNSFCNQMDDKERKQSWEWIIPVQYGHNPEQCNFYH